ncbi:MAG: family 78 glycoside hydrolase catalytic domain, partial [Candidatus Helarchaeota archaeon]
MSSIKLIPTDLKCEYLVNPLGIDVLNPRLSWIIKSNLRNVKQTAYRIIVSSSSELLNNDVGDLWDTGIIKSDQQNQIAYSGKPLSSRLFCHWKVKIWDNHGNESPWSKPAFWSMGLLYPSDWKASWIGTPKKKPLFRKLLRFTRKKKIDPSPLLRFKFHIDKNVKKALLYASALGEYILYLNGSRIGDHFLAPEWTDYDHRVQYQTYDVSNLLKHGENVIGAILGDGWYIGNVGFITGSRIWGVNRSLILQLEIEFEDNTSTTITSNDKWKYYDDGPIRRSDHYLGEIYDSSKELPGWNKPGFDDLLWHSVSIHNKHINLVAQKNEPIRIVKSFKPISINQTKNGTFIFDIGQNISGFCKIKVDNSICGPHSKITLRHAEVLNPDGTLYTKNLRFAKATDIFIYDG